MKCLFVLSCFRLFNFFLFLYKCTISHYISYFSFLLFSLFLFIVFSKETLFQNLIPFSRNISSTKCNLYRDLFFLKTQIVKVDQYACKQIAQRLLIQSQTIFKVNRQTKPTFFVPDLVKHAYLSALQQPTIPQKISTLNLYEYQQPHHSDDNFLFFSAFSTPHRDFIPHTSPHDNVKLSALHQRVIFVFICVRNIHHHKR